MCQPTCGPSAILCDHHRLAGGPPLDHHILLAGDLLRGRRYRQVCLTVDLDLKSHPKDWEWSLIVHKLTLTEKSAPAMIQASGQHTASPILNQLSYLGPQDIVKTALFCVCGNGSEGDGLGVSVGEDG